jgi:hypothetical protein
MKSDKPRNAIAIPEANENTQVGSDHFEAVPTIAENKNEE